MASPERGNWSEGWPEARHYRKSVRTEFSLLVAGMMMALMLVFGYVITDMYVSTVSYHLKKSLLTQARSFTATAGNHIMAAGGSDQLMLNNICSEMEADIEDLFWAGITDDRRVFLAHTDIRAVVAEQTLAPDTGIQTSALLRAGESMTQRGDTIFLVIPIEEEGVSLGYLGIASSAAVIQEARSRSIITVVAITGVIMLIGIPITVFRLRGKLRPLTDIALSLRRMDPGKLDWAIPYRSPNEIGYLAETLRVMGQRLAQARQELLDQERITQELRIAHEIQANLLPRDYPRTDRFAFAGMYQSAREVGGDYYDFIQLDHDHLAFIIADVSGKSVPGMLVMLLTRDIVKRLAHSVAEPAALLSRVNQELFSNIREGMFVTMIYGVLHQQTGHCRFASAGHNSLVRVDGTSRKAGLIKTRGMPLGLVGADRFGARIESAELTLRAGDWLLMYTDGISEAKNASGEQFGMGRLLQVVEEGQRSHPEQLIESAVRRHQDFVGGTPQYDDITLVALRWYDQPSSRVSDPAQEVSRVSI